MNEDRDFENFLKDRLEAGVEVTPAALEGILRAAEEAPALRRVRPWWRALPMAASFLVIFALAVLLARGPASRASAGAAVEALQLLCEAGEVVTDAETATAADLLLAWQDAPYRAVEVEVLE